MTFKVIALIAALSTAVALADDNTATDRTTDTSKTTKTTETKLTDQERAMLAHYHHLDRTEITMGKMAQRMGGTKGVKDYGATLVKDHTRNDREFTSFAKRQGVTIGKESAASEADARDAKASSDAMAKLQTLKGRAFDREFLPMMVEGHQKEVALAQANLGQVENADLRAILNDTIPMLQRHEAIARDLEKRNSQASTR